MDSLTGNQNLGEDETGCPPDLINPGTNRMRREVCLLILGAFQKVRHFGLLLLGAFQKARHFGLPLLDTF